MSEVPRLLYSVPAPMPDEESMIEELMTQGRFARAKMQDLLPYTRFRIGRAATLKAVYQEPESSASNFNRVWLTRRNRKPDEPISMLADTVEISRQHPTKLAINPPSKIVSIAHDGYIVDYATRLMSPSQQLVVLERTALALPIIASQMAFETARSVHPK